MDVVDLSRLQFAITALYHFLFVPLTLGLVMIIAIMETVYVATDKPIWKDMTKFWGMLFGINFAMGVATGITMEFQFGTNWSYYAHYVGDIFGVPLAIEGMMAFFLEATLVGVFFFGWDRLSKRAHLICTWGLALGTSISAFWILVANGWMQDPKGAFFNPETMRMELRSLYDVIFNITAQCKFVHTVNAGYTTGAMFVTAVSFYYLYQRRHIEFAKRSLWVSTCFGLFVSLSVLFLGDESGYTVGHSQKMKLAAMEGKWRAEAPPASLTVIGWPDMQEERTKYAIKIPYVMGLIATRSFSTPVLGIRDIVERAEPRIRKGIMAYTALEQFKKNPADLEAKQTVIDQQKYLGYALLLKRHTENVSEATNEEITRAAHDLIPNVPLIFFCFRIMVGCGLFFIAFFTLAFLWMRKDVLLDNKDWFLRIGMLAIPLPWMASSSGWIVAECGRQPWAIDRILPTYLGASQLPHSLLFTTLGGFILLYSTLLVVDLFLMIKYVRLGPDKAFGHDGGGSHVKAKPEPATE
ncbi:cytochrome ubiquinol oxidase subunit I [Candidatus Hepatobacter penaei]|uniref:cytochrome ubiquinol oxidase subunit I n=1 Tax=Candidatus Hepatobacter penaei TaxID=1274402 RepID=UPI0009E64FF4|nr:cytochrome ubiquinol oxidase subunit I [Candidatus Hepatobacter penaei]TGW15225.1 cytochrome bd-I ubiquinol oxidase subunit CydA [bacterium NHP-B]